MDRTDVAFTFNAVRGALERPIAARVNLARSACDRWAAGGRVALFNVEPDGGVRTVTFDEISELSCRLANGLAALGVTVGDRVVVVLPQSLEAAVSHVAIQRLGAVAVPVSQMYGQDAVSYRIDDSGARIVIADAVAQPWLLEPGATGGAVLVATGEGAVADGQRTWADLVAAGAVRLAPLDTGSNDPAILIYTSGTTGRPKGALHAQRVVPAHAGPVSMVHNLFPRPNDVLWSPADWAWAGGLIDCLLSAWWAGQPIVAYRQRRFDPEAALAMMASTRVTTTFLPPTALRMLQQVENIVERFDIQLRSIMTGGEPSDEAIYGWCADQFGFSPNEVYGQTEASCLLGNSSMLMPVKPGSLGMPLPGSSVAVIDDFDKPTARDEIGEIAVHTSSPAVFLGYWNGDAQRVDPVEQGWLRTKDLGRIDPEGYHWFVARRDDVILSAGYRIGPAEIEECLRMDAEVVAAAVVGIPDVERGQVVKAFIELRPGASSEGASERLRQLVRRRLAPYHVPREVEFVDELPRTVTGKIQHAALRRSNDKSGSQS